jgi:peroxiredoxin
MRERLINAIPLSHELQTLQPGDLLVSLNLIGMDGANEPLARVMDGRPAVLAVFNTRCQYCKQTLSAWKDLNRKLEDLDSQMIGVSLHPKVPTEGYVTKNGIDWPVWIVTRTADQALLKLSGVPTTVLLSSNGTVLQVWEGLIEDDRLAEIAAYIADNLPSESASRPSALSANDDDANLR